MSGATSDQGPENLDQADFPEDAEPWQFVILAEVRSALARSYSIESQQVDRIKIFISVFSAIIAGIAVASRMHGALLPSSTKWMLGVAVLSAVAGLLASLAAMSWRHSNVKTRYLNREAYSQDDRFADEASTVAEVTAILDKVNRKVFREIEARSRLLELAALGLALSGIFAGTGVLTVIGSS